MENTQPKVNLFKIVYSAEILKEIECEYQILDNLSNERPDWFEYWPIRKFLLNQELDADSFYGFFSPRFKSKTGLSGRAVKEFVIKNAQNADVVIFSPQPDMGAFFLNVFEQAEVFDSGMIELYEKILEYCSQPQKIENLIMDSRQIIFSNYFVAKPKFWKEWLDINEKIYELAEEGSGELGSELRKSTDYPGSVQKKVFLQERTASFLLKSNKWKSVRYDAFSTAWSASALNKYPSEAIISDALKIAFNETGDEVYFKEFAKVRSKIQKKQSYFDDTIDNINKKTEKYYLKEVMGAAEFLEKTGKLEEALQKYRDYLMSPGDNITYVARHNSAVILQKLDRMMEAEEELKLAIHENKKFLQAYLTRGLILERLGRKNEAVECWNAALGIDISCDDEDNKAIIIKLLNNIGRLEELQGNYDKAEEKLAKSLDIQPEQPDVLHHWIHLRQKQCKWPIYEGRINQSDVAKYASPLSILSLTDNPQIQLECAQRIVSERLKKFGRIMPTSFRYKHDKIKIGYLSSDLSTHAVSLLTVELFELHNREKFEVHAFCWSPEDGTEFRERVRNSFDYFHRINHLSDEESANLIQSYEIDILVDLQGLSARARPEIIARGPAPIQITWLGYPGTSAIPNNDYIVADEFILPFKTEKYFTEKPIRLKSVFQVSDSKRAFGPEKTRLSYGLPADAFVYCAFNNNYKITEIIFHSWMDILKCVPHSVLWLLEDNKWARENLLSFAAKNGIEDKRIIFAGRIQPADYLQRFRAADLFLDTMPYNAGTTANDALWAGLPLLTYSGKTYVSRMAGSLLNSIGINELIAQNLEEYKKIAIYYGNNQNELEVIRKRIKYAKEDKKLFNTERFVVEFEAALINLVESDEIE